MLLSRICFHGAVPGFHVYIDIGIYSNNKTDLGKLSAHIFPGNVWSISRQKNRLTAFPRRSIPPWTKIHGKYSILWTGLPNR